MECVIRAWEKNTWNKVFSRMKGGEILGNGYDVEKMRKREKNANSPTSTVTWTLIFPLSLEAENISVEMSLPIFWCPPVVPLLPTTALVADASCPLLLCFVKLLLADIRFFVSSIWYESLSLPSGDLRTVVSYDAADDVIDAIAADDVDEWFVRLLYWCAALPLVLFDDAFDDMVLIAGIAFAYRTWLLLLLLLPLLLFDLLVVPPMLFELLLLELWLLLLFKLFVVEWCNLFECLLVVRSDESGWSIDASEFGSVDWALSGAVYPFFNTKNK